MRSWRCEKVRGVVGLGSFRGGKSCGFAAARKYAGESLGAQSFALLVE